MQTIIIPVTPFQQNCSLLICPTTRQAAIVDPGGDLPMILAKAKQHAVIIEKIFLTHGHLDHCAAAGTLAQELGIPIEGPHRDEQFWLDQLTAQTQRYGFPTGAAVVPDRWLEEGDIVCFGNVNLNVYHCPGHTPGHIVFYSKPDQLAIVGDVIFAGSIGRTDFPRGNHADLIRSIRDKLFPLGDDITFVPGHGPTSTFGAERAGNPYVGDHLFK